MHALHIYNSLFTYICTYIYIYTYMYTQLIQTRIHIGTHIHAHAHTHTHTHTHTHFCFMARQPLVGLDILTFQVSRSHSDTPHSVGLLWTSDRPVAEISTLQHTTLTRDRHPCLRRDSNPQSRQASGYWDRHVRI